MTNKTCVETYNGLIPQMREEGYTLQAIGDTCGVTRERIRQILEKHYPNKKSSLLSEATGSKLLGFKLENIRLKGLVSPKRKGNHWLYDKNELEKAMRIYYHPCLMCEKVEVGGRKYCQKCVVERKRNAYPFKSQEMKRRHLDRCRRWIREHPERAAEIQRKAMRAYGIREREGHFRETIYVVFKHCALPIGVRFKAINCLNHELILLSGIKIPVRCVKIANKNSLLDTGGNK